MDTWAAIISILSQLIQAGIVFGILGYFFYRERGRRRENLAMLERMTPEQLAEIRRTEARIDLERKRHKAGNLGYLRIGMIVVGAGCGLLTGLLCFIDTDPMSELKIIAAAVVGMGFFMFLEFLIELRLRRMEEK